MPSYPPFHTAGGLTGWWQALKDYLEVSLNTNGSLKFTGTPTGTKFLRDDLSWQAPPGTGVATDVLFDAKGDLAVGTGSNAAAKLVVGSNTQVLTADSTQSTGLKWATPAAGGGGYPATGLVAFVDYANGSDSNDGLTPSTAYQTIQAAYNALKTYTEAHYSDLGKGLGVGTLLLFPGRHDVGTGLSFASNRPVVVQSMVPGRGGSVTHFPSNTAAKIVSSNAAITEMVKMSHASAIGYGFEFRDLAFEVDQAVNTLLTKIIWASKIGNLVVDRCSASTSDNNTNQTATFVYHEDITTSSGEAGWVRVTDNNVSRFQLYAAQTTTGAQGGNFNRGVIANNVVFYGGTLPMIGLFANVNGYLVEANNLEGTTTAVEIGGNGSYTQNTFLNNSGEDPSSGTPAAPFYKLSGNVSQQMIIGGTCSTPAASGAGTWVNFGADAYRNMVMGAIDLTASDTTHKRYVSETSNSDKNTLRPINIAVPDYTVTTPTTSRSLIVKAGAVGITQRKFLDTTAQTATTAFSPGTAVAAGTLAILATAINANKTITSVADSAGNTWVVAATASDGTRALSIASCQVATQIGTGGTITITWSNSTSSSTLGLWLLEATNMATSSAFDKTASGTGTNATPVTAATAALSQDYELVVGIVRNTLGTGAPPAIGATYTSTGNTSTSDQGSLFEYKIVDSVATVTADATWSGSGTWIALAATYKAAQTSGAVINTSQVLGTLIADLTTNGILK